MYRASLCNTFKATYCLVFAKATAMLELKFRIEQWTQRNSYLLWFVGYKQRDSVAVLTRVIQGQWWVCRILWLRFYNFEMFYDVIRILTNNNCCSQPERLGGREGGWRKIVTIERRDQNLGSNCKKIKVENELVFSTGNASYIKLSGFLPVFTVYWSLSRTIVGTNISRSRKTILFHWT